MHPRAVVIAILLGLLAGCAGSGGDPDEATSPPRVGERAEYALTFRGVPAAANVSVEILAPAAALDAWARPIDSFAARAIVREGAGGYDVVLHVATATREAIQLGPPPDEFGVRSFAEPAPQWVGYPAPGPDTAMDIQRCILLPTVIGRALVDGAGAPALAGVPVDVERTGGRWTLRPRGEGMLVVEITTGAAFLPTRGALLRPDGTALCTVDRTSHARGGAEIALGNDAPAPAPSNGSRGAFVAGLPPIGQASLAFPLGDAMAAARRDPKVSGFLAAHPYAYLIEGELIHDRPDDLDAVRTDEWILRFADTTGDAIRFGVQRSHMPTGVPVDRPNVIDEEPASGTPPLTRLTPDPYDLAHALRLASDQKLGEPSRISWAVTRDPALLGTPEESSWQILRLDRGTRTVVVSGQNGQLLALADVPFMV